MAGAGGMLGTDVVDVLRGSGEDVVPLTRSELDIRDLDACLEILDGFEVVVNAAGWTDVDAAEAHEAEAFAVNASGAANVARACQEHAAVVVHVSTDYVFDGQATSPYAENAPMDPLNAYGRTKAAGEWAVRALCLEAHVVRTAWLYGAHGSNFVRTMLRLAGERDVVQVVSDQRGQPTWTRDLAVYIRDIVLHEHPAGVHHGTSSGEATWFDLAREAFILAGLDPARVKPVSAASFRRPAARPTYSVLENRGVLPDWQESLRRAMPELLTLVG